MAEEYLQKIALSSVFTRRVLPNLPPGRRYANGYGQGLVMLLNYASIPADYDTIMGDSGLAFILPSEEGGPMIGSVVDVGWRTTVVCAVGMRLGFLSRTVGREIRWVKGRDAEHRADPKDHYWAYLDSEVKESILAGRLVLAEGDTCFVTAGYDDLEPPLLGYCSLEERTAVRRIGSYPRGLMVLGDRVPPLDRRVADLSALCHAVALCQDRVDPSVPACSEGWDSAPARFTGQKSFALWAEALRDAGHPGEARWHADMALHLGISRSSAIAYLRAMSERHPRNVAARLRTAADTYEQVLNQLRAAGTNEAGMTRDGRMDLAEQVDQFAVLEEQAGAELLQAVSGLEAGCRAGA